jgi:hypothetical protein
MAERVHPYDGFFDDEATHDMSEAFVKAWRVLGAQQAGGCDDRAEAILRKRIAKAVIDLAAAGNDSEMMAHGAIDRISAASRFRTV